MTASRSSILFVVLAACSTSSVGGPVDGSTVSSASDGSTSAPETSAPEVSMSTPDTSSMGGCPRTACDDYATKALECCPKVSGCKTSDYDTWKRACEVYVTKCEGSSIPSCFCTSDCGKLVYCYDYCPK